MNYDIIGENTVTLITTFAPAPTWRANTTAHIRTQVQTTARRHF